MKRVFPVLATLLCGAAMAQTTVGNVTITRPGDVKNVTAPRPVTPAPKVSTTPRVGTTPAVTRVGAPSSLPTGWRYLSGRIEAPQNVDLPAGSKVQVSIVEVDRNGGQRATHLNIGFETTALSTPYRIQYNPARMNSAENVYLLRAKVFDRNGNLMYMTKSPLRVPTERAAQLNIPVSR